MNTAILVTLGAVSLAWMGRLLWQTWREARRDREIRTEQAERTETIVRWRP